jgi:hypothetical protein
MQSHILRFGLVRKPRLTRGWRKNLKMPYRKEGNTGHPGPIHDRIRETLLRTENRGFTERLVQKRFHEN